MSDGPRTTAAETRIAQLERELTELEQGEGMSFEAAQKEVNAHHKVMHEYNEAKDACQILFGRLASMKGVTVKEIHEDYDILAED